MLRTIVYVPQWIVEAIQRKKLNLSVVLDVNILKDIVSLNDLVGLVALNQSIGNLLGLDINLNIGPGIVACWEKTGGVKAVEFINNTIIPNITPTTGNDVIARLTNENWETESDDDEFLGIDIATDASAIILKNNFFDSVNPTRMQYKLIEEILQVLYVYHPHHLIANTAIGRKYLELLALNQ